MSGAKWFEGIASGFKGFRGWLAPARAALFRVAGLRPKGRDFRWARAATVVLLDELPKGCVKGREVL
jgi:hypothetical protein